MGNNSACCKSDVNDAKVDGRSEPVAVLDDGMPIPETSGGSAQDRIYKVMLNKSEGGKLGLDVDYMAERSVLPIMSVTGGLSERWNKENPDKMMNKGDSIIDVNGTTGDVSLMLEKCKSEEVLSLTLCKAMNYDALVADLENLIKTKKCGPILIRLSWHDAGVCNGTNGCPNAAMRHAGGGEHDFDANAGLPTVAIPLLKHISDKYCPAFISHADLWVLASNVAIRVMGGPEVPSRFGRVDAKAASEGVESQVGRLPDGDKGVDHLRAIFHPKGFDDKGIVALSGAHTVGKANADRSGFDGPWTEDPLKFDNSYFKDLLKKSYTPETTEKGKPQHRNGKTIMLISDLALLEDEAFKTHVQRYAEDEKAFFADFVQAWVKMQELNCSELRDIL